MSQDDSHANANKEDKKSLWTFVTRKSRSSKRGTPKPPGAPSDASENKLPDAFDKPTLDAVTTEYLRVRATFENEVCAKHIRKLVAAKVTPNVRISNAINMGIGQFGPYDNTVESRRSTYVQLIAFLIMVEEMEKITKQKIPCIFQEPVFTRLDVKFIKSLGHSVVKDPEGCRLVNGNTFFFGVHLYRPVYSQALEPTLPAIFVGTVWGEWEDMMQTKGLDCIKKMHKTYDLDMFPPDSRSYAFSSTCIYWKKDLGAEGPGAESGTQTSKQQVDGERAAEDEITDKLKSTTIS